MGIFACFPTVYRLHYFWVWEKYQIMLMMYWICQKDVVPFNNYPFLQPCEILCNQFFTGVNYSSYLLLCMKLWQIITFIVYCDFLGWKSGQRSKVVLLSYVVWSDIFQWYIMANGPKGPRQLHSKVWFLGRKGSSADVGTSDFTYFPSGAEGSQIWVFQQTRQKLLCLYNVAS